MAADLAELTRQDRNRLFRFLTAAIWADGEAAPEEIDMLTGLILELGLEQEEMQYVSTLLLAKPRVEEVLRADQVPLDHRKILVDAIRTAVLADGQVSKEELASVRAIGDALQVPIALPDDDEG